MEVNGGRLRTANFHVISDITRRIGSGLVVSQYVVLVFFVSLLLTSGSAATLKSTCKKVGYKSVIDEKNCDLVAVSINRCSGFCMSFSFANPLRSNTLSVFARCCRMVDAEIIDVELNCGSEKKLVKIPSATECACFDCA
ncbi:Bursicon [Aphelenchoides besseyi]|nr:Bursicon [Aphelenchoides besseyi]KAI6199885.1 Bursicon [Aphelenchoides besseyi]